MLLIPVSAQEVSKEAQKAEKKAAVKSHLKQHFKPYGFIRNYFTFDSRECIAGTGDLYFYMPKDEAWNQAEGEQYISGVERQDLNAVSSFRFLSLTTRVGLDIVGYKWRNTEFGAKIEADFYTGLSTKVSHPVSGVAQFRLRQAYLTLGWDSLPMLNGKDFARVDLTIGQTWHPMAADLCDVISLNSGAPFGPFNRSPQVKVDARLGKYVTLTGALLWQMQYKKGEFSIKAKTIFAESGEHMNMNGGYGVSRVNPDGSWSYTPTRTSSSWISLVYGGKVGAQEDKHPQKLQGILFAGYVENLGTKDPLAVEGGKLVGFYYPRVKNMRRMWRITPTLLYTIGKFQVGLEYDITSVHYGDGKINPANGLSEQGLHWVTNHRVQLMTKYNF